ncbi:glucose-1-phosphate adenylyltransferase [Vibrio sp.]|nr:glucose-1-phosphate adenylyltransferase [Vibrio sp.]
MQDTLAVVLAGGMGSRLSPLTDDRAKPAVPFAGKYRIIDFTLTNCLHSGLRRILVLTQYKSHSLQKHLRDGWSIFNPELGEYITAVPPQMRTGEKWYQGTADAIFHNMWLLDRSDANYVIVLSGDHIYRMDYAAMLEEHKAKGAELTIACMEVDKEEAKSFGVMGVDEGNMITHFIEKPETPPTLPHDDTKSLASMGIYIFRMDTLQRVLEEDADNPYSDHDFGKNIIPKLIDNRSVFAYRFGSDKGRAKQDSYWRDVGTLDSFYEANMDLLKAESPMDLYQEHWPIRTYEPQLPPARTVASETGNEGIFTNSIISNGVLNAGGSVQHSIISSNVVIGDGTTINKSLIFDDVQIGSGCKLANCIIDKHVRIPDNTMIGFNRSLDEERFPISDKGVVIVPEGYEF